MASKGKKILIVEDDKDYLWILRQSFAPEDVEVIYAQDGQEGLQKAKTENPDLMIVDIQMPKMDGISMAKEAKKSGVKSKFIFLTNLSDTEHISEALGSGERADYIVKSDMKIDDVVKRAMQKLSDT